MGGFNAQSVNDNGGVAWAKQVAQTMDPGAIDSQVQSYQNAVTSLSNVQTTLQNVKNNLAASWMGDAAEQAQQSFQGSINHTQLVQDTITQVVVPALQSAKTAQSEFIAAVKSVPDEQTVPSNSVIDDVGSWFGVETPAQTAQSHNTAARAQAATAINTLSDNYESSANKLSSVGGGGVEVMTGSTGSSYNLGQVATSSGDGAATGYSQSVSSGGRTSTAGYVSSTTRTGTLNTGPAPKTTLAGNTTSTTDTLWNPPGSTVTASTTTTLTPDSIWSTTGPLENEPNTSNYPNSGLITDEPAGGGANTLSENNLGEENLGSNKLSSGSGLIDETNLGDGELTGGSGTGLRAGGTSSGDGSLVGAEEGTGGTAANGETTENGMNGSMGRGMGGSGAGDEELGSSKYTRGRYLGNEMEEDDSRSASPVRSVYEDATDTDGNKVNMMGSGRRGSAQADDEEDERGKRPSYLKEDEFWSNAQRIVPPVIQ